MSVTEQRNPLDVRQAAALVNRHPETIRRWVWSGKLAATRVGTRLMVEREAVLAASGEMGAKMTLAEWAEKARAAQREMGVRRGVSASDLVIQDRAARR